MKNKKKHHINTFAAVDGVLLFVLSLICLLPIINVLAISFSSRAAADAGRVALWLLSPIGTQLFSSKF